MGSGRDRMKQRVRNFNADYKKKKNEEADNLLTNFYNMIDVNT